MSIRPRWVWAGLAVGAGTIRLLRLDHFSFWLDEILELFTVRDSWSGLWRSLSWQGLHAPLDYVLQKVWFAVGAGGAMHRLPPVAWGVLGLIVLGRLLARRAGLWTGLWAAVFLAISPFHVRFSQEVRPYSLGMLFLAAALLALDMHLERPRAATLAAFYACCLGCLFSLYLAAFVLAIAAAVLTVEDSFDADRQRRAAARAFLRWSPVHAGVIILGFLPWWPVAFTALRAAPMTQPPPLSPARALRWFAYFGFNPNDGYPFGPQGLVFAGLVAAGLVWAARSPGLRFLIAWAAAGLVGIELLEHSHPTYDSIFHWLPAGMALAPLAAFPVAALARRQGTRLLGAALAAAVASLYVRGLVRYFDAGRPDWRPLARYLAAQPLATYSAASPPREQLFVENQYAQLCLAYYLVGPHWLCCRTERDVQIANVNGDRQRLEAAWKTGTDAWLVLAAGPRSEALRAWAARFPGVDFPAAELGGTARHLHRSGEIPPHR